MSEEIKNKILKWILENHEHHTEDEDTLMTNCIDGDFPYVNSVELEKFIKML